MKIGHTKVKILSISSDVINSSVNNVDMFEENLAAMTLADTFHMPCLDFLMPLNNFVVLVNKNRVFTRYMTNSDRIK